MEKKKISNIWKAGLLIAAMALVGVGTTLALLKTSAPDVINDFASAKINVQVVEKDSADNEYESDDNDTADFGQITQNEEKVKVVAVENKHSESYPTTDTFVRVRLVPILRDSEGNNIAKQVEYTLSGLNTTDWTESQESRNGKTETYYYYNQVLLQGKTTAPLFEGVKVLSEIPEGAAFEFQVLVDAIQARPYPAGTDDDAIAATPVYQAWGWHYDTASKKLVK